MKKIACLLLLLFPVQCHLRAQDLITKAWSCHSFPVVSSDQATAIIFDASEDSLIYKSVSLLQKDVEAVTGKKPKTGHSIPAAKNIIIIGSINKSPIIKKLIETKKLDISKIKDKWEGYQVQTVRSPFHGVDRALVITGSDPRGTAYGVFELSRQLGVSPWYWWADVPVKKSGVIYIDGDKQINDYPKVKYRGIFINDEAPALSNWGKEKFGGFNHLFYEKVFELMLRLKANYLWPAMWGSAFYDDDSLNKQTADNYGMVIGTSHHEPLMRAHDEWRRYGKGKWNYDSNEAALQQFWREGLQRATNEKVVSIGMRGDGDEPMARETATALLERIVRDQRRIIEEVSGRPAEETPQLWALYKEVLEYYDKGMRVPDDVTLLLCDDNWGNIRRLPKLNDPKRKGGYGIYYHYDYVGGPRNYKWINTNNLARVWEQMHLAWEFGAREIWIVNVGDIKPMELPTSFFLDYAWDPTKWNEDNIRGYYTYWAAQQFGKSPAQVIGDLLRQYSQYAARIKPELLNENTYNLANGEFENVLLTWQKLSLQSDIEFLLLPANYQDAFFQLVYFPIQVMENLHELYLNVANNHNNAKDSNSAANGYAKLAKYFFDKDSLLTLQYHQIAKGKWNHMMSQTHIGYTYWQQPPYNKLPDLKEIQNGNLTDTMLNSNQVIPTAKNLVPKTNIGNIFYEKRGVVSIGAEHWSRAINFRNIIWKVIPDIGKTGSGITTFPVTATPIPFPESPHVEYDFYTYDSGEVNVRLYFSPTLNFLNASDGLQFAVSIDDDPLQMARLNMPDTAKKTWESWVANNIIIKNSTHRMLKPGKHVLKYWMVSPAVILQKAVIDFEEPEPSYLGPPETKY